MNDGIKEKVNEDKFPFYGCSENFLQQAKQGIKFAQTRNENDKKVQDSLIGLIDRVLLQQTAGTPEKKEKWEIIVDEIYSGGRDLERCSLFERYSFEELREAREKSESELTGNPYSKYDYANRALYGLLHAPESVMQHDKKGCR